MGTFTMRLPDPDHEALRAMAELTGRSLSDIIREAAVRCVQEFVQTHDVEAQVDAEMEKRRRALQTLLNYRPN